MSRRALVLVGIVTVLLAGCLGGPTTSTPGNASTASPGDRPATVSVDDVPGVSNGSLTNASALARANEAALGETGGELAVSKSGASEAATVRLRLAAGFSTYSLTGSYGGEGQTVDVAMWTNESARYVRMQSHGDVRYQSVERTEELPGSLRQIEGLLASGDFTVANESAGDGRLVLTADEYVDPADGHTPFSEVSAFDGRLVVDESGQIHNLTVSAVDRRESVSYGFALRETGVDTVPQPDWFAEMPRSATLDANVDVAVENESYLVVRHRSGDAVPAESTLTVTSNGTTRNATFGSALGQDDVRYAYVDASDGDLRLVADPPASEAVSPLTSPVSVALTTPDGVTLHSGGMAWESGTVSAGDGSGGTAEGGAESDSEGSVESGGEGDSGS
jgi:hypothetical protein